MTSEDARTYLGIATGPVDPAVAVVRGGRVIAHVEEERFVRDKHAIGRYPVGALQYCLQVAERRIDEIDAVAVGWNCAAYSDGRMRQFFEALGEEWPLDAATREWQHGTLRRFNVTATRTLHERQWARQYGDLDFPPIRSTPHHFTHAFQAAMESPFESAVVLTMDGSGDEHTTVLWRKNGAELEPLREIQIPHSLGWFYAAFTEYLGFTAYDGEYKVMGLAAHGGPDKSLHEAVSQVLMPAQDGIEYRLDPTFIHYGDHTYSDRHTDKLVKLLGAPPRLPDEDITAWHMDLAFAVQQALEDAAVRLVRWAVRTTGIRDVCLGGGVALNVKMNSRILELSEVDDVFAHPLCADSGAAAGAALAVSYGETGLLPPPLTSLALGPQDGPAAVEATLRSAGIRFERSASLADTIAGDLAAGKLIGWCEGRMEAGPRALGQRSILADPRDVAVRDRVNAVVKHRELWRPFGPAMLSTAADRYFDQPTDTRFMMMALRAKDALVHDAPAIVHSDGTSRVQLVPAESDTPFARLLHAFDALTGVPVLLNTSFNVKGEPIVCSTEDALRTFWSTGLDVLVLGDVVVRKGDPDQEGGA